MGANRGYKRASHTLVLKLQVVVNPCGSSESNANPRRAVDTPNS